VKEVLDEREVFAGYNLGISWLRKRRRLRLDPTYIRIGRMVRYRREDIESFLIDHLVSTTEGGTEERK
jgi:hypothetical protein